MDDVVRAMEVVDERYAELLEDKLRDKTAQYGSVLRQLRERMKQVVDQKESGKNADTVSKIKPKS